MQSLHLECCSPDSNTVQRRRVRCVSSTWSYRRNCSRSILDAWPYSCTEQNGGLLQSNKENGMWFGGGGQPEYISPIQHASLLDFKEVTGHCDGINNCDFITLNGVPGIPSKEGFSNTAWLCTGKLTMVPRPGWITATKCADGPTSDEGLYQGYPTLTEWGRRERNGPIGGLELAGQSYG
eukprot:Lankesteria_metandrocarpae@DN3979_c0_g1_i10.p1